MDHSNTVYPQPPTYQDAIKSNNNVEALYPQAGFSNDTNYPQLPPYPASLNLTIHPPFNREATLPGFVPQVGLNDNPYPAPTEQVIYPLSQDEPTGFTAGNSFEDKSVAKGFLKKVYAILCVQLAATVGIVSIFTFVDPVREYLRDKVYWIFITGGIVLFVYICTAFTREGKKLQRRYPANIVVVVVLTLSMSCFTGVVASYFRTEAVIFAFIMCAGVCFIISALSFSSKFNTIGWAGYIIIPFFVLIWFGIVAIATYQQSWFIQVVYGFIGAFLFGIFLAYDTNSLIDDEASDITPEDYVTGAIRIYVDVVVLFILILAVCFGGSAGS